MKQKKKSRVLIQVIMLAAVVFLCACSKETPQEDINRGNPEGLEGSKYNLAAVISQPPLKDLFSKYFSVGTTINGNNVDNTTIRSPELAAILKKDFNSLTYSNLMKACYLLDEQGCKKSGNEKKVAVTFDSCREGLEFAQANNIKMRGHVLVWHTQAPEWFFCKGYDISKGYVDKETMLARMEDYIKQVLTFVQTEYPGVIYAWDVVNEAVSVDEGTYDDSVSWNVRTTYDDNADNLWYKVIGKGYVEKAFEYARKYAAKGVSLMYNDFNTFDSEKCVKISNLLKELKAKKLVDGIGMQSAMTLSYPSISSGIGCVKNAIQAYADLGMEIHMSEITIRCDGNDAETQKEQGDRYEELFQVILAMDSDNGGPANITNVTFFGLMDKYMMYPDNQDCFWLLDDKLQPKQSYYGIKKALETYKKIKVNE